MQRPVPRVIAQGPVPESTFFTTAQLLVNQNQGNTSTIQQGEMAKKLLALKKAERQRLRRQEKCYTCSKESRTRKEG